LARDGLKMYRKEQFQDGLDLFRTSLDAVNELTELDPAILHYNLGYGYYRMSQPESAAAAFRDALKTSDLELQGRAYFNLGNSLHQIARRNLDEGKIADAFRFLQEAQTNYVQSMRIDPADRDAKVNYELTILAQTRILQMVAMAMSRLQQGDQLVGEFKFVEAAQWFQENLPTVEKALSLEPEMKKQFEKMTERSAKVAEIIAPPADPMSIPGGSP
jgi:tetratricopeptide (TPR) repeat protein